MITTHSAINKIETIYNTKLNENIRNEMNYFIQNLENKFSTIESIIEDQKLEKVNENLSDFKLKYIEKIKFLNFIKENIFPLNLRAVKELDITKYLSEKEIGEIEFGDRVYCLYKCIREDLTDEIETSNTDIENIKVINIQHLYNNFNNSLIKEQIINMKNLNKISFGYGELADIYDIKDLAIVNASRIVSSIDYFFNDKIFVYRKTKGTNFTKLRIKFKKNDEILSGNLIFKKELSELCSGGNIIVSKNLKIHKNPYQFVNAINEKIKFLGDKNFKSILDNSYYTDKIFTRNSKYVALEILDKERNENFDNEFILKILNYIQSFPICIDSWALEKSKNINLELYKEINELKKIKYKKAEKWKEKKENTKKMKDIYNKIGGFMNEIKNNSDMLKMLKMIEEDTFYFRYMLCARYRLYPKTKILNYQNFKILRIIFKGIKINKEIIISTYEEFLEKHKNKKKKILENIFFYNKIKKENYEEMIKLVSIKLNRKINIKRGEESENKGDIILCNFAFYIIIRIGAKIKKMSTCNSNDEIFELGLQRIKNPEIIGIHDERIFKEGNDFNENEKIEQRLYSFDATTSMIQMSSIICFADNEKILMQCGIIDPFKYNKKIDDVHDTILNKVKENTNEFIKKNNLKDERDNIINLIDRKFIKSIHIPFSYGQGDKTLLQNVNKKHRNNEIGEKILKKTKNLICKGIYNNTLTLYQNDLPHIIEAREVFEDAYRKSSISIGGEILNMPIQTDISDIHIEFGELIKKRKKIGESIKNINSLEDFAEQRLNELYSKMKNVDEKIEKINNEFEEKELVKRINISSIVGNREAKNFKTINKYKVRYLKQNTDINKEKMDRCAYVNCIQNGDATALFLTNNHLMLEKSKITVLGTHDCGSVSLFFADLFEISYKMSLIEMVEFYMNDEKDPIQKEIYKIDNKYIEKRKERKKIGREKNFVNEIWESSRLMVGED